MKITAYYMEVKENGVVYSGRKIQIENREEAFAALLGGEIKVHILPDDMVLCERKNADKTKKLNRVYLKDGLIQQVFFGSLLLVKQQEEKWVSLTQKEIEKSQQYIKPAFDLQGNLFLPEGNGSYSLKNSLKSQ